MELNDKITVLKGIGEKRASAYEKLGLKTVGDLLLYPPRTYTDFTSPVPVNEIVPEEQNLVRVRIITKSNAQRIRRGLVLYKAVGEDSTGKLNIVFYNNRFSFDKLEVGMIYRLSGRVNLKNRHFEMNSPEFQSDESAAPVIPRYPLTEGLTAQALMSSVREALDGVGDIPEILPDHIRFEYKLCTLDWAVKNLHFPKDAASVEISRKRLAFDELVTLQCAMKLLRSKRSLDEAPSMGKGDIQTYLSSLPFELTGAQQRCINEILSDMKKSTPMNRLVQGDVGSGKTAVAAAACFTAYENGYQSAFMAPTEILAAQHFNTLSSFLTPLGVKVTLLTGSMTAKQKKEVREVIAAGEADVIIGTHSLISDSTSFFRLGLIITDEQHRFGVEQRKVLAQKGEHPHKLVMSATPIPRTLALIMYGDLDISVINEMPRGRQKTETFAVTGKLRERALSYVEKELAAGHQAYIVCPMIEQNPEMEVQSATEYEQMLHNTVIGKYKTALLHGRMSGEQKDSVMTAFKSGEVKVLVSTTVIEVGVDVPNATIIMIESAERFGLSQLHQLRGRVGRGGGHSACILLTDNPTEEVRERLRIMSKTSDGFDIAEEDLKMRGAGDFFGTRQSGLPPFKFAGLSADTRLLSETSAAAQQLFEKSPDLSEYPLLLRRVEAVTETNGEEGMN